MSRSSLIEQCQAGKSTAWDELFEKYAGKIYRWAMFFGLNESGAEDVTQEVFIVAMRRIDTLSADYQLNMWLFKTTRYVAANYRRNAWMRKVFNFTKRENEELEATYPGLSIVTKDDLAMEVRETLKQLPAKFIEVLIMHDLDGYTRTEISEALGIPPGTVASRLHKARRLFDEAWRQED